MPASRAALSASIESVSLTPDQPICLPPISAGPPMDHAPNVSGATRIPVRPKGRFSSIVQCRHFQIRNAEDRFGADRAEADLPASRDRPRQLLWIGKLG